MLATPLLTPTSHPLPQPLTPPCPQSALARKGSQDFLCVCVCVCVYGCETVSVVVLYECVNVYLCVKIWV